jgi:hypothetical protein
MQRPQSPKQSYDLHRLGVKAAMKAMQRDGFQVERADSTGFTAPGKVELDRPDAVARHREEELFAFGVCKTADDIDSERSRTQLLELGSRMMKGSQALCPLYIAAPSGDIDRVRSALAELGLAAMPNIKIVGFTVHDSTPTNPGKR